MQISIVTAKNKNMKLVINSFKLIITTILIGTLPNQLKAHEWDLVNDWTLDWDACRGEFKVSFLYYFDDSDDDFMEYIWISYYDHNNNEQNFVRWETYDYSGRDFIVMRNGKNFYVDILGQNVTHVDEGYFGDNKINISFYLKSVPDELLSTNIKFRIKGKWNEGGGADQDFYNQNINKYIRTIGISAVTNVRVTENECNRIRITWDDPTDKPCYSNWITNIDRKRSDSTVWYYIGFSTSSNNEFIDNTVPDGIKYDYRTHTLFEPNIYQDDWAPNHTPAKTGFSKPLPPKVTSFTASTNRCDGKVLLEWNYPGTNHASDTAIIQRSNSSTFPTGANTINIRPGNNFSYVDSIGRGVFRYYRIKENNECNDASINVNANSLLPGVSPTLPVKCTLLVANILNNNVNLSWTDLANNETGYVVERMSIRTGIMRSFNVPALTVNSYTFKDSTIALCEEYEYKVYPINSCVTNNADALVIKQTVNPDLSTTFASNSLDASKGYYPDKVELKWDYNNKNVIRNLKIYRKLLSSPDSTYTLITTQNSGTGLFHDLFAEVGILYQYKIQGEAECGPNLVNSNFVESIGFRNRTGTITGQVNYAGGIAVENVKITAEANSGIAGKSIQFTTASGSLKIKSSPTLNLTNDIAIECWFKPNAHTADFTLMERLNNFSLKYIHSSQDYEFKITEAGISKTITISKNEISINSFNHIYAQANKDSLYIYVNGIQKNSVATNLGPTLDFTPVTNDLNIGVGFTGYIDELRIWKKSKTYIEVIKDYSRIMNPFEVGLLVYLRMDEGVGSVAYDVSNVNNNFNKNHASWQGSGMTWSNTLPNPNQLANITYSDPSGNYLLNVSYNGTGQVFTINPSYLTHQFSPSTTSLFIGDGALVHNSINFIDNSSFRIQGSVVYNNTSCGVEDVYIKLNGVPLIINGGQAKTDPTGAFDIQVPIGEHYIELDKQGHVFNVGRFPSFGTFNFQEPLAGLLFKDSTLIKITGRVVGGNREKIKPIGFGLSKNNIGVARIEFKSLLGNGCSIDTVYTDSLTGEYECFLPPLRYIPTVKVLSNLGIVFSPVLQDFSIANLQQKSYKTDTNSLGQTINVDSFEFNYRLDYIYKVDPKIHVFDADGVNTLIGDSTYTFHDPITQMDSVYNIKANPYKWPIFTQGDGEKKYNVLIRIFEEYANLDYSIPKKDTVPTTSGLLRIDNEMVVLPHAEVQLENAMLSLDTLKSIVYSFKPGYPNFIENISIPSYSFTKKLEINLDLPGGKIISWLPVPTLKVPPGGDKIYRAYLLGTQSNGDQFLIQGPQVVEYILRDPPGTSSSAARSAGSTESKSVGWSYGLGGNLSTKDDIYVGTKFSTGIGVEIETDIENNFGAGYSIDLSAGGKGSLNQDVTLTREWSTYSGKEIPTGANSDLFIGQSKNIQFGVAEELTIIPENLCSQGNCFGNQNSQPDTTHSFAKKYGLSVIPGGYETHFMVNQFDIENFIIPDLKKLRNLLLQTNLRYTSHLPVNDLNYGRNNDDPVFGINVSSNTPDDGEYVDLNGPSYTMTLSSASDTANIPDSVRLVNTQIKLWEKAIYLNEWEKVNIDNYTFIDSLKQAELELLEDEYKQVIDAYTGLAAIYGINGISQLIFLLTPLPGAAFGGYASFAVTAGTGVALNELNEEFETYLLKKENINKRYQALGHGTNYTLTGGTNIKSNEIHSISTNVTRSVEYNISAELGFKAKGKVGGAGVGFEKSFKMAYKSSKNWSNDIKNTESVAFTMSDPDIGDIYSVDVYPSVLGFGPIFKNRPGGRTSCPHEDEEVTKYYEPGTVIAERTLQIDKPKLSINTSKLTNVPVLEQAVFNLNIANESEVGYINIYQISIAQHTNPFGAIIGGSVGIQLSIPGGTSVNRVITIGKGPGPVHNYDSILVLVHSTCQFQAGAGFIKDIVDSVYISAHFLPTCSNVALITPEDRWIANNFNNNTLPIVLGNYNVNFNQFEKLRIDYKPSNSGTWIELKSLFKDTTGIPNSTPISTITPTTQYNWNISDIPDGNYDLRVGSKCTLAGLNSLLYTGIIDRINPHPFGNPSPADGILSPNDEIAIQFNEPIDIGSINPATHIDIRGVLNGGLTDHRSFLNFDGNDYIHNPAGVVLQKRDFTFEFTAKRDTIGEQVIFAQGTSENDRIFIGFDANNKFVFRINNHVVKSSSSYTDLKWRTYAVSYDYELERAELFVADGNTTPTLVNVGNTSIQADFTAMGGYYFGKNSYENSKYFRGNLHDVRIWNYAKTLTQYSATRAIEPSNSSIGLLHNWRMNEAEGKTAIDYVRKRDGLIVGPIWQVSPNGKSCSFNPTRDYLTISTSDVAINDEMNSTIEFWFKSNQAAASTLFSNGTGTGTQSDSLYSWNIDKNNEGKFFIKHAGVNWQATDSNYFDNNWHHFALVLRRGASLTCFVDGNQQKSTSGEWVRQLSGPNMYLGVRAFNISGMLDTSKFYRGYIDEFRVWSMARSQEQILRDKRFRLLGNEAGLVVYLPFETYTIDNTGVPILSESFTDVVNSNHIVSLTNSPSFSTQTPTIRLPRPVQEIAFTHSVNNDKMIITPSSLPELIENVTLDVTVHGIKDLRGNVLQSPATWIAYVDKNQVIWQEDKFDFIIMKNQGLKFTSTILNKGGASKKFQILDIPSWLTVSQESGTVPPNSTLEIHFTVDPLINIGNYEVYLGLLTDFNFVEKLNLNLSVKASPPQWYIDPSKFEYNMNIIGLIKINDVISIDTEDKVAAFIDGELRGSANLEYVASIDAYRVFLTIFNNTTTDDLITFKLWDASNGKIYSEVIPTTQGFSANTILGTILSPVDFVAGNIINYEIPIRNGWNWLSFFLENQDFHDINGILSSVSKENNHIKNRDAFANCNSNLTWSGSLTGPSGYGIQAESMYKLNSVSPDTLVLKGTVLDPSTITINLDNGWTWIGFISLRNQSIQEALGNLTPSTGDIIKSKSAFAIYSGITSGWLGNLKTLVPGEGYMYKSAGVKSFTYPQSGMFDNFNLLQTRDGEEKDVKIEHENYPSNMTVIVALENDCDKFLKSDQWNLVLIDEYQKIRAKQKIDLSIENTRIYLTAAGDVSTPLQYKLTRNGDKNLYSLGNSIQFKANEHVGSIENPYWLKISKELCQEVQVMDQAYLNDLNLFPTITKLKLTANILSDNDYTNSVLQCSDVFGKICFKIPVEIRKGMNQIPIHLEHYNPSPGSYLLEWSTDVSKSRSKFIITK